MKIDDKNIKIQEISSYNLFLGSTETLEITSVENEELFYIETQNKMFVAHCRNNNIQCLIEWKDVAFVNWKKNSGRKVELKIPKELEKILF